MTKKLEEEVTWGMLCEGFQSLPGIPDKFYSAEDPEDRKRLWNQKNRNYSRGEHYRNDSSYKD